MDESILATIRKMVGGAENGTTFDTDLIVFINTCLTALFQIGVGNAPFSITGEDETWSDFLGDNYAALQPAQSYIFMKTKLMFDSNSMSGSTIQSFERLISECEWRLYVATNPSDSVLGGQNG